MNERTHQQSSRSQQHYCESHLSIQVVPVEGTHHTMTRLENLRSLGAAITGTLAKNSVQIRLIPCVASLYGVRYGSLIGQRSSWITFSGNTKNHGLNCSPANR
jgi:hypothetical protein